MDKDGKLIKWFDITLQYFYQLRWKRQKTRETIQGQAAKCNGKRRLLDGVRDKA